MDFHLNLRVKEFHLIYSPLMTALNKHAGEKSPTLRLDGIRRWRSLLDGFENPSAWHKSE
jgi:hypothetical protein